MEKRQSFISSLEQRFDISAEGAESIILSDQTLSPAERKEDLEFLKRIQANLPHSLGCKDVKRVKRMEASAQRKLASEQLAERDIARQVNDSFMHSSYVRD